MLGHESAVGIVLTPIWGRTIHAVGSRLLVSSVFEPVDNPRIVILLADSISSDQFHLSKSVTHFPDRVFPTLF